MRAFQCHRFAVVLRLFSHLPRRGAAPQTAMSSYVQLIPVEIGQIKAHIQNGLGATQIACIIKNTEVEHPSPLSPTQPAGGHPAAAARVAHGVLQAPRSATFWVNKTGKKALRRPSRNKKERARDVLPLMGGRTKR